MDRIELKKKAQEMIKGNKWYLWKPMVIFELLVFAITFVVALIASGIIMAINGSVDDQSIGLIVNIASAVLGVVESVFMIGYAKYVLDFVRGKKSESNQFKEIFGFSMKHFGTIFLVDLLVALIIIGGCCLLIIPGIIFAIGHIFYQEVCVDNIDLSIGEIISKSWNLTKGHKADLFVLVLSFIGWIILAPLTLFILYIWLIPYMTVTFVLAYEQLIKKAK